jgi:type IV pilus assembly protein PilA
VQSEVKGWGNQQTNMSAAITNSMVRTDGRVRQPGSPRQTTTAQGPRGFSLIELLIVVTIILIIAAIAIPNLLRARIAANEASAVESLRSVATTNTQYYTTYGIGYAASLATLGGASPCVASAASACMLDVVLTTGAKSGYTFVALPNTPIAGVNTGYEANATPQNIGTTGQRSFCADQTGVLRYNTTGAAIGTAAGTCAAIPAAQTLQ